MGLIYHRPPGENSSFHSLRPCLMMGEVSLETLPKNIMIQDVINSENSISFRGGKSVTEDLI